MSQALVVEQTVGLVGVARRITIRVASEAVYVSLEYVGDVVHPGPDFEQTIYWEQLDDVEHLVSLFEYEAVKTFKTIVEMLGKIHSNKNIYLTLL